MKNLVRSLVLAAFLALTFSTESLAQGVGQCEPYRVDVFGHGFSPKGYSRCLGRSGAYLQITGYMYWDQARADNLRRQAAIPPFRRFTIDITDLGHNLGHTGLWATSFPYATLDSDDDNGDGQFEETEATANTTWPRDESFPRVYDQHWFTIQMRQHRNRTGILEHTPAVSLFAPYQGDNWQTSAYEGDGTGSPRRQSYSTYSNAFLTTPLESPLDKNAKLLREAPSEKVDLPQPLSVEEFTAQISSTGKTLKSFVMEYEVETEDGLQIVTVGGVPNEKELIPFEGIQELLNGLPHSLKIIGFRGVVSYKLVSIGKTDEK